MGEPEGGGRWAGGGLGRLARRRRPDPAAWRPGGVPDRDRLRARCGRREPRRPPTPLHGEGPPGLPPPPRAPRGRRPGPPRVAGGPRDPRRPDPRPSLLAP